MDTLKKLNQIIPSYFKKRLILLLVMLTVGMLMEIVGIGLIIPLLNLIIDPEQFLKIDIIRNIVEALNFTSDKKFIILSLGFLLFIYLSKAAYIVSLNYKQNIFSADFSKYISNRIFSNYMERPYQLIVRQNSSDLIKNLQVEIPHFSVFLGSIINIITELGLAISVIITLIYVEPLGSIFVIFFFSTSSFIFFLLTRGKLSNWGKQRIEIDKCISKNIIEGLSAIKDIIVLGRQSYFKERLSKLYDERKKIAVKQTTTNQVPRHYLELTTIFALVGLVLIIILNDKNVNQLVTTMGVFVAGTFRLIPSANKILTSIQNIKYYHPSVALISDELSKTKKTKKINNQNRIKKVSFNELIEIDKLGFSYSNEKKIFEGVSFTIKKGSIIGIIGSSGSGKSTLIDVLIRLLQPTEGFIKVDENLITKNNISEWRNMIGYVPQEIYLTDDSIKSNIAFGIPEDQISKEKINRAIDFAQLKPLVNDLNDGIETYVGERGVQLSGGQRQRIGIARALYNNPDILILDEATSALDTKTENQIMKAINKLKGDKTILIVAHRHSTLRGCDRVYEVKNRKLSLIDLNFRNNVEQ